MNTIKITAFTKSGAFSKKGSGVLDRISHFGFMFLSEDNFDILQEANVTTLIKDISVKPVKARIIGKIKKGNQFAYMCQFVPE